MLFCPENTSTLSKEEIEHNSQKDAEEGLTALHVN
jgi:hypothetical protein